MHDVSHPDCDSRWSRVFLPGDKSRCHVIIRDDLEDNDEDIENGL